MSVTFTAQLGGQPVDMANANAAVVLDALGLPELDGIEDADVFLGRVLLALAIAPQDAGRPAVTDGRITDCGRPTGYLHQRLTELHHLAQYARTTGVRVTWG